MTINPDQTHPTPVPACTVLEFASRLGLSRRAAHDLFAAAAAHLNVVIREGHSGRLTVPPPDFQRMVALVETLNSVGLTIRQLARIQQCQDPELWNLLQGPRAAAVVPPVVDHHPEVSAATAAVERIEAMLVDHLAQQEALLRQHLSPPAPIHLPAPVPTPVRARDTQADLLPVPVPTPAPARPRQDEPARIVEVQPDLPPQPLPVPVPARAPSQTPTDWPEHGPMPAPAPARVILVSRLEGQRED